MPSNLVEGGARRGVFQTRHSKTVRLTEPFEFSAPPQPGREPETRICWHGTIFQADGKTVDTNGVWERSGAFQNSNGVIQRNDLVILVSLDPLQDYQCSTPRADPQHVLDAAPAVAQITAKPEIDEDEYKFVITVLKADVDDLKAKLAESYKYIDDLKAKLADRDASIAALTAELTKQPASV